MACISFLTNRSAIQTDQTSHSNQQSNKPTLFVATLSLGNARGGIAFPGGHLRASAFLGRYCHLQTSRHVTPRHVISRQVTSPHVTDSCMTCQPPQAARTQRRRPCAMFRQRLHLHALKLTDAETKSWTEQFFFINIYIYILLLT